MSGSVRENFKSVLLLTADTCHLEPDTFSKEPTMYPFLRIGRRKFLRDSALGLGVAPLMSSTSGAALAGESPPVRLRIRAL